jgi:hypothetical protein
VWKARGTYLADLEAALQPDIPSLQRETRFKELEPYFVSQQPRRDQEPDWRQDFVAPRIVKCIDRVAKCYLTYAEDIALSREDSAFVKSIPCWIILQRTSYDIMEMSKGQRKKTSESIAQCAAVEYARSKAFIHRLLNDTALSRLRLMIHEIFIRRATPYVVKDKDIYEWVFPDGLGISDLKVEQLPELDDRTFSERLKLVKAESEVAAREISIQNLVKLAKSLPVSSHDGFANGWMEDNAAYHLEEYVRVSPYLPFASIFLIYSYS